MPTYNILKQNWALIMNFKSTIFLLLAFNSLVFAQKKDNFALNGKIIGTELPSYIYIQNLENEPFKVDSSRIVNGRFRIEGKSAQPTLYSIFFKEINTATANIFLENTNFDVLIKMPTWPYCEIVGGDSQQMIDGFGAITAQKFSEEAIDKLRKTMPEFERKGPIYLRQMYARELLDYGEKYGFTKPFAYLAQQYMMNVPDIDLEKLISKLEPGARNSMFGNSLYEELQFRKATALGSKPQGPLKADINKEVIRMGDYFGKYVLLYFWSSADSLSRAFHEEFVNIHKKYQYKNVVMVAVSMDKDKNAYLDYMKKGRFKWINIFDGPAGQTSWASYFHIKSIPYSMLLDREGYIFDKERTPAEIDHILGIVTAPEAKIKKLKKK